jgi:hypothetical protein
MKFLKSFLNKTFNKKRARQNNADMLLHLVMAVDVGYPIPSHSGICANPGKESKSKAVVASQNAKSCARSIECVERRQYYPIVGCAVGVSVANVVGLDVTRLMYDNNVLITAYCLGMCAFRFGCNKSLAKLPGMFENG